MLGTRLNGCAEGRAASPGRAELPEEIPASGNPSEDQTMRLASKTGVDKPILALIIGDLQAWVCTLEGAPATRRRPLAAAKLLLAFASRMGYVSFNVGTVVRLLPAINVLAERILTEEQVVRLIALEQNARNHALLRLLCLAGLRVSCKARRGAGQITVVGKRGKVRSILLPAPMWRPSSSRCAVMPGPRIQYSNPAKAGHWIQCRCSGL
jgi:hypothetical protein